MPHGPPILYANPAARSGRASSRLADAVARLASAGLRPEVIATTAATASLRGFPRDPAKTALALALARRPPCVLVTLGGDGTFREAAEALLAVGLADEVPVALLPAGTANNLARSFGIPSADPRSLPGSIAVILAGHETRLDAGHLELRGPDGRAQFCGAFFDSVGFGVGAAVIAARNADRARAARIPGLRAVYRDELVYAGALARTLYEGPGAYAFEASLALDGGAAPDAYAGPYAELLVRGTRVYAGRWVLDPTSRHDDGLFEVFTFPTAGRWLARAARDVTRSALGGALAVGKGPATRRCARLDARLRGLAGCPLPPVQCDGEELARAERAVIEVRARALRLLVPEGAG